MNPGLNRHNPDILHAARYRPLPVLAQALEALCDTNGAGAYSDSDLAGIVSREPALLLQALRISSQHATPRTSVSESLSAAIHHLGRPGLQLVAMGVVSRYPDLYLSPSFLAAYTAYWYRAVATAAAARHLSLQMGADDGDIAYLCGLMLGIGRIPMMLAEASGEAAIPGGSTTVEDGARIEAAVGEALLEGVAPLAAAADVIRYRCFPPETLKTALPLVKTVAVADMLAAQWSGAAKQPDEAIVASLTGLGHLPLESVKAAATDELAQVRAMFRLKDADFFHAPEQPVAPCAVPSGLIRVLARNAAMQAETTAISAGKGLEGTMARLSQTLAARFGIRSCVVWRYLPGRRELDVVFSSVSAHGVQQLQCLPIDAPHAAATACRENGVCVRPGEDAAGAIVLADRQMMDMLGAEALVCVPFGGGRPAAGVVLGGIAAANQGEVAGSLGDIQAAVTAAFDRSDAGTASAHRSAGTALTSDALDRLMVKKTVHEIRTPLSIIKNYLSVLRLKLAEAHTAQYELGTISEEIDRLGALLEQLVLPSPNSDREWLSVNDIVRQMLVVIRAQLVSSPAVAIHTELDDNLPAIFSDRDKIKQIVLNLLKNALEAMPDGGNIRIGTRSGSGAPTDMDAQTITLVVGDDGPGINDAVKARMFQPFNSTKTTVDSGLGLYIVRGAVAELGGSIRFVSPVERGTEVLIELPVSPGGRPVISDDTPL